MVTRASGLWGWLVALCVGTVLGCREVPATQLLVMVDSDLAVDGDLNHIDVFVTEPGGREVSRQQFALVPRPRPAAFTLPLSFGVVPIDGDARRRVRVVVRGYSVSTGRRVELTALTGFLPNRKLLLSMFLQRACVGVDTCALGQTCIDGVCADETRPPLPDITGQDAVDASGVFDVTRTDATRDATSPDVGTAADAMDVPAAPDVPDVPGANDAVDVPVGSDVPDAVTSLPTPRLTFPATGSLTNSRLLWFEFRATDVPPGTGAAIELCGRPDFPAADTVILDAPDAVTTGAVTRWDLSSVNADSLVASNGPIGSSGTLWWRVRLAAGAARSRSVAWPFRLRPAQPARARTLLNVARLRAIGQAGDFNGDGLSDVFIVTARSNVSNGGNFALGRRFLRTEGSAVHVSQRTLDFGRGARLGDIDGDGLEDFGVATGFPSGSGSSGAAYLVMGSAETAVRTPELIPSTVGDPTTNPMLLAPVMDADRDGVGEFAVGLPTTGTVRLYRGAAAARSGTFTAFAPPTAGPEAALSLSTAGDFNGDGRGDFVVGYPSRGAADLFVAIDVASGGFLRVPLEPSGLASTAGYGAAVAGGGDINGDGFSDVVVAGTAGLRAFYGGASGVAGSSVFVDPSPCGGRANDASPRRLANLGDLDGDGGDEVGFGYVGACMIVLRGPLAAATGNPALAEARTLFPAAVDPLFANTIAAAGDYDGDGLADFSVGIPNFSLPERSTLKVYFGDPTLWAEGMSGDGGVAPTVMALTPGMTGWGYSVASRGRRPFPAI